MALGAGRTEEAEERLSEAIRLSREIGAITNEAMASLRLGEAARARGEEAQAEALLADALALSRWSPLSRHLQPLSYAALVVPPGDPGLGCRWLEQAEPELAEIENPCVFCSVSFNLAAAVAAARAGEPERAGERVAAAEESIGLWPQDSWRPSLEEARGEIALARGDGEPARELIAAAAADFTDNGRVLDAKRLAARLSELS